MRQCAVSAIGLAVVGMCASVATAQSTEVAALIAELQALTQTVQAQTPEIDALRVRAEAGEVVAQFLLGVAYATGRGVFPQDDAEAQRLAREWDAAHPREP